jgi:hypothetical protein
MSEIFKRRVLRQSLTVVRAHLPVLAAALALLLQAGGALAQSETTVDTEATASVALRLDTRFRYVHIDESNKTSLTNAPTLRAVVGADIVFTPQFGATLEFIHTGFFGSKRFSDDPVAFASPFPLLPDPRHTGLNEAFLKWAPSSDWTAKFGRQSVKLGNERHVSDDNFRNVPQLFDGGLVVGTPWERAQLTLGQFDRIRTRLGTSEPMKLTLAELAMNPMQDMSVAAYGIRHRPQVQPFDLQRFGAADRSNWVLGAIVDGSYPIGSVTGYYTLEAARQRAAASGSNVVRASYLRGGIGIGWSGIILRVDHERRGSNGGRYGFQMPLTNQYAFNGNALQFFDTPVSGTRDSWLTMKWDRGPWSMLNEMHWFRSDDGNDRYGRELDVNVTYTIKPHAYVRAQWAHYRTANPARGIDVDKVWLTVGYDIK